MLARHVQFQVLGRGRREVARAAGIGWRRAVRVVQMRAEISLRRALERALVAAEGRAGLVRLGNVLLQLLGGQRLELAHVAVVPHT